VGYGYPDGVHYGVFGQGGSYYGALGRSDGFSLVGNGSTFIAGSYTGSDKRLKEDIKPLQDSLAVIEKMNPVSFKWKKDSEQHKSEKSESQLGLIAQEVQKVLPQVVTTIKVAKPPTSGPESKKRPLTLNEKLGEVFGVDYSKIVPVLIGAVKELSKKLENIIKAFEALKAQIEPVLAELPKQLQALRSASEEQKRDIASIHSELKELKELKSQNANLARENKALKKENEAIRSYLCGKDPKAAICH
jgi:hypothetical protein